MNDLEKRYKAAKESVKCYNRVVAVDAVIALIGAILTLVSGFMPKPKSAAILNLEMASLGICATVLVMIIAVSIIYRKEIAEYNKIRKECKDKGVSVK